MHTLPLMPVVISKKLHGSYSLATLPNVLKQCMLVGLDTILPFPSLYVTDILPSAYDDRLKRQGMRNDGDCEKTIILIIIKRSRVVETAILKPR